MKDQMSTGIAIIITSSGANNSQDSKVPLTLSARRPGTKRNKQGKLRNTSAWADTANGTPRLSRISNCNPTTEGDRAMDIASLAIGAIPEMGSPYIIHDPGRMVRAIAAKICIGLTPRVAVGCYSKAKSFQQEKRG